ncbi:pirin family protein [uncultured Maribacter sp.]|mgnify:CR=1 FL=1|uniref:pirin family protein n=1 Tax=uncultured Maribacter sp. TaxID=431308 RepID=UPI0030ED58F0|tara:strand:- start:37142 stop:37432 length:291 start_codon:yes stop_codon:yes gene_type:complete
MKTILHKSDTRGHADYEWLNSYRCFSFTHYHNPERMLFGVLRVLNDDMVVVGLGFDTHPYSNMEIISIKNIETNNSLYQILSPNGGEDGVWIHQDT